MGAVQAAWSGTSGYRAPALETKPPTESTSALESSRCLSPMGLVYRQTSHSKTPSFDICVEIYVSKLRNRSTLGPRVMLTGLTGQGW